MRIESQSFMTLAHRVPAKNLAPCLLASDLASHRFKASIWLSDASIITDFSYFLSIRDTGAINVSTTAAPSL